MARPLRLELNFNPKYLQPEVAKRVRRVFDDVALDLADQLQQESPVGATGQLAAGWNVTPAKRSPATFDIRVFVTNSAPKALQRIVGQGPGPLMSPSEMDDLADWAEAKGMPRTVALPIAKKIAKFGTQRWRDRENFAGLDRRGRPMPGSPILEAEDEIARRVQMIADKDLQTKKK